MSAGEDQVAETIADQIGRKAFFMMGTRFRTACGSVLFFDIRGCVKFNRVRITLDCSDTYTVEFLKLVTSNGAQIVKRDLTRSGVYAEDLKKCLEHNTGLCLSL